MRGWANVHRKGKRRFVVTIVARLVGATIVLLAPTFFWLHTPGDTPELWRAALVEWIGCSLLVLAGAAGVGLLLGEIGWRVGSASTRPIRRSGRGVRWLMVFGVSTRWRPAR